MIVYGNGINTTQPEAVLELAYLQEKLAQNGVDLTHVAFCNIYDSTYVESQATKLGPVGTVVNTVVQSLQAAVQVGLQTPQEFWYWWSNRAAAPDWFNQIEQDLSSAIGRGISNVLQPDIVNHVQIYQTALQNQQTVIAVAHSQGNLYLNQAYELLFPSTSSPGRNQFKAIAVATPANQVAASGPYTTLYRDPIYIIVPGSEPWNVDNGPCVGTDQTCYSDSLPHLVFHNFTDSYIDGTVSGPRIISEIIAAIPKVANVSGWPQSGHDPMQTFNASSPAPTSVPTKVTSIDSNTSGTVIDNLIIADDGTIIFHSNQGFIKAYAVSDQLKWSVPALTAPFGPAGYELAVGISGTVYELASQTVRALSADTGAILWTRTLPMASGIIGVNAPLLLAPDETLIVHVGNGTCACGALVALNKDGSLRWQSSNIYPYQAVLNFSGDVVYASLYAYPNAPLVVGMAVVDGQVVVPAGQLPLTFLATFAPWGRVYGVSETVDSLLSCLPDLSSCQPIGGATEVFNNISVSKQLITTVDSQSGLTRVYDRSGVFIGSYQNGPFSRVVDSRGMKLYSNGVTVSSIDDVTGVVNWSMKVSSQSVNEDSLTVVPRENGCLYGIFNLTRNGPQVGRVCL